MGMPEFTASDIEKKIREELKKYPDGIFMDELYIALEKSGVSDLRSDKSTEGQQVMARLIKDNVIEVGFQGDKVMFSLAEQK